MNKLNCCCRDVAADFIKSHRKLEDHCTKMYEKLKVDRPPTIAPPPTQF